MDRIKKKKRLMPFRKAVIPVRVLFLMVAVLGASTQYNEWNLYNPYKIISVAAVYAPNAVNVQSGKKSCIFL